MVFYRKYRPQTIRQLDNKSVRESLFAVLSQKSIAHAFLFTGPKGLGKTSAARIVAKVINCEKKSPARNDSQRDAGGKGIEPCNKCDQCVSITNGTNMDVLEIDGASNRGIDEIRDLREKIRLAPLSSNKKVYIIDEVHMLTTEAFNALLKTLEEPPAHAIFILCTTEPQKIPATITSRCFHIAFSQATEDQLLSSLNRIVKGEKLTIDKEALYSIAQLSEGSFRDGAKILEHVAALSNRKKISKTLIEQLYKTVSVEKNIKEMIEAFAIKDVKKALQKTGQLAESGVDMKYFIEQLIYKLHEILLAKVGIQNKQLTTGNLPLTIDQIRELIQLLAKAHSELKHAVLSQLPLELAVIEWGQKEGEALRSPGQETRGPVASLPPASAPLVSLRSNAMRAVGSPSSGATPRNKNDKSPRASDSDKIWQQLIDKIKFHNHSVAGVLRGCRLQSFDGKKLMIETNYKFHKDKLNQEKTRLLLEKAAAELIGSTIFVFTVLKAGDKV